MLAAQLDRRITIEARSDFYVYAHKRLVTGVVFYVGKGCGRRSSKSTARNPHWQNIVTKDGGFLTDTIASGIDEELAFLVEIEAIDIFRKREIPLVNMTDGGEGVSGLRVSDDRKMALAESMKGNKHTLGYRHTEDAKRKIALAGTGRINKLKGTKISDEVRMKMQPIWDARIGTKVREEVRLKMVGRVMSEEARMKISIAHKGRKKSEVHIQKMRDRVYSDEQKNAARVRATGRIVSDETRKKMSGKTPSDEVRAKLSLAQTARWAKARSIKEVKL